MRLLAPQHLVPFVVFATMSGCVLGDAAEEFNPALLFEDRDDGEPNNQVSMDLGMPQEPPLLIFTELLIDAPGSDETVVERGEYIELKNVGDGPADPRNITIFLTDLEQPLLGSVRIEVPPPFGNDPVYEGLQLIQPGQYFVFIRYEDPDVAAISEGLRPGSTYDFGRHANGPTLPHQAGAQRALDVGYRYPNGEVEPSFDQVRWVNGELIGIDDDKPMEFEEGQSLAVDADAEDPIANNNPENWCSPPDRVGQVQGTPGRQTMCP